jgi:hypothetical protein
MPARTAQPIARWIFATLQDVGQSNSEVLCRNSGLHIATVVPPAAALSHLAGQAWPRAASTLADIRTVDNLAILNDELAEAVSRDRAMARRRLYNRIMPGLYSETASPYPMPGRGQPQSAVHIAQLSKLVVCYCGLCTICGFMHQLMRSY